MFYYTYLVIPTLKTFKHYAKVYFGKHQTNNLNDGYVCSSKIIKKWCKTHPNDYYREIIAFYNSEEELNRAEYELIHPHLEKDYCLNLKEGGEGGKYPNKLHPMYGKHRTEETKQKIRLGHIGKHHTKETIEKLHLSHLGKESSFKGKKHTEEAKQKQRQKHLGKSPGNKGKHLFIDENGKRYYK